MAVKKRGLGRGLDALLGDIGDIKVDEKRPQPQALPIESLQPGRFQPRKRIDPERLEELADSIGAQGIVQPIVVRPGTEGHYEIIAGERRWRAAQIAGLHEVPVMLREISDQAAIALALIENIQREDLKPLEEADALHRLLSEFEMTHQQIADAVGKSRATITNLLRLLDLHPAVKKLLEEEQIEMGHARALLSLEYSIQSEAARKVVAHGMTVRATEKMVREWQTEKKREPKRLDPDLVRFQDDISARLGAQVQIRHNSDGKGKIIINYSSLDQLEGMLERIR